jgi:hypothetical protein
VLVQCPYNPSYSRQALEIRVQLVSKELNVFEDILIRPFSSAEVLREWK